MKNRDHSRDGKLPKEDSLPSYAQKDNRTSRGNTEVPQGGSDEHSAYRDDGCGDYMKS